jgi:hypothetical protein
MRLSVIGLLSIAIGSILGCAQQAAPPKSSAPGATDFAVRLKAAREIGALDHRDEAFSSIAADGARAEDVAIAKEALGAMSSIDRKDACASECALLLAAAGRRESALEIARLIASVESREKIFRALASADPAASG